jgi:hypothetical protein
MGSTRETATMFDATLTEPPAMHLRSGAVLEGHPQPSLSYSACEPTPVRRKQRSAVGMGTGQ